MLKKKIVGLNLSKSESGVAAGIHIVGVAALLLALPVIVSVQNVSGSYVHVENAHQHVKT